MAQKIIQIIAEISASSDESAQGIEQLTQTMSEIDRVTQQNAAGAEETASNAEEMNAQAEQLKNLIAELEQLIGNTNSYKKSKTDAYNRPQPESHRPALDRKDSAGIQSEKELKATGKREIAPDQLIPLDEDDFDDF